MKQGAVSVGLSCSRRGWGRRAALGALVVVALALGGCAPTPPDPPPTSFPTIARTTATASPSPTPSPTTDAITPPERPAEMDRTDEVGAAAAAEYFMRLFPYVLSSQDLEVWNGISGDGCNFCRQVADWVEEDAAAGKRYEGGEIQLEQAHVFPQDTTLGGFTVQIAFEQEASRTVDDSGVQNHASEAYAAFAQVDVIYATAGWALVELSTSEEPVT